jgi:hypothetical protein
MPDDITPQAGTDINPAGSQTPPAPVTDGSTPDAATPESVDALPSWAQKIITDLRGEAANTRRKAQDERKQAEEKRLETEKRWEELANQRATEIATLTEKSSRYEALEGRLRDQILAEVKHWPEEVRALVPATTDVQTLMDWRERASALVAKLATAQNPPPGTGKTPAPAGQGRADTEKARKEFERSVRNL